MELISLQYLIIIQQFSFLCNALNLLSFIDICSLENSNVLAIVEFESVLLQWVPLYLPTLQQAFSREVYLEGFL